ncbi:MAG: hypothetical protein KGZ83_20575 [Sulfuricella sp.]|nr:hypothetical protein [Sulfuricella sp.]
MKKLFIALFAFLWAPLAFAVAPYLSGDKLAGGDLKAVTSAVEKKLQAEGFEVVGQHAPKGLPGYASVIVTDKGILDAIKATGGQTIVGAGIRVGVKADGSVSYMNPEYWYRAYFRKQYGSAEGAVKAVQAKLAKALGAGKGFGGDVTADDLPNYRYMFGMERFDADKNELKTHASFEAAVKAIQDNLAKGVGNTAKVYEIVMADKKLAVFGVALNDPKTGEGWWVNKTGPEHIAALPYEIYVIGNKTGAMFGRYRIALAWPSLGMGTFMTIADGPDLIQETLAHVTGGTYER